MNITVLRAEVDQSSYLPEQEIVLRISFQPKEVALTQISNASVNISRAEQARDQFAFAFGSVPFVSGNTISITQKLPSSLPPGIYRIDAAILNLSDTPTRMRPHEVRFNTIWFAVRRPHEEPIDSAQLRAAVSDLSQQRQSYVEREICTDAGRLHKEGRIPYRVIIFGAGCLVPQPQQMAGYSITPLRRGFSHCYLNEIVDTTLRKLRYGPMDFDQATEVQHQQGTPTFYVEYWKVLAIDHQDALGHCSRHVALVFELLGLDRGQKPREFFRMAVDMRSGQRFYAFQSPWYRGNLVSDFNPVSTANFIDAVVPNLETNPFLRLLLRSYAEATAELDWGIALLRFWTVLELLADSTIQKGLKIKHPNGDRILNEKGSPRTTKGKSELVYQFILANEHYVYSGSSNIDGRVQTYLIGADRSHPDCRDDTVTITLWDMVRAVYAIRNTVAHEGTFSIDLNNNRSAEKDMAIYLMRDLHIDLMRWIRDIAWLATRRKLHAGGGAKPILS